jgi:hypothetical protein
MQPTRTTTKEERPLEAAPEHWKSDGEGPAQLHRPARALVGWMQPEEASRILCGLRMDRQPTRKQIVHAERARAAVAVRPHADDRCAVEKRTSGLDSYVADLRRNKIAAQYFVEGWDIGIGDLTRIRAFQPTVFVEQAAERVASVDAGDVRSLAAAALPIVQGVSMPLQFDKTKQAWMVTSPDLNLRVLGNFSTSVGANGGPKLPGIGFVVAALPSMMKVVEFDGRHFLTDGYHRAFGFVSRGITRVPVFTRRANHIEELGLPPNILPQEAFLGLRPPFLPDYLADEVSAAVNLPVAQKMIVIQALELTPHG